MATWTTIARAATALVLVTLTAAGCGGDGETTLDLSAADSGAAIEVEPGTVLVLTIDSNQTTGFRWNLVQEPDAGVLAFRSSTYEEPEEPLPGSGGVEVWRFEAIGEGTTSFELGYFQPWEPDVIEDEFSITVTVA
jgi:inhibitor of cysteine peptidase